jgi:hypothetical protein
VGFGLVVGIITLNKSGKRTPAFAPGFASHTIPTGLGNGEVTRPYHYKLPKALTDPSGGSLTRKVEGELSRPRPPVFADVF